MKKRCIFRLDFFIRFGVVLGSYWESKRSHNRVHFLTRNGLVSKTQPAIHRLFAMGNLKTVPKGKSRRLASLRPFQEGFGRGLGPSWGGLGPLLGALGPSLEGLGVLLGRLEAVLGCS